MSTASWIFMIVLVLLVLVIITLNIYYYIAPPAVTYYTPLTGKLSDLTTFNDNRNKKFITDGEGSLSIFIYLDPTQRTPTYRTVSKQTNNESNDNQTSNYDLSFNIYSLGSGNSSVLTFKQYPGSSSGVDTAEIRIKTINPSVSSGSETIESFQLKAIPLQKWICVTLSRSGRRYNIYYNTELVSSFRTNYYPIISTNAAWHIGDSKSSGYYAYASAINFAMTKNDIDKQNILVADSRNEPKLPKPSILSIFSVVGGCPNGIFCYTANGASTNGFTEWSSPYS